MSRTSPRTALLLALIAGCLLLTSSQANAIQPVEPEEVEANQDYGTTIDGAAVAPQAMGYQMQPDLFYNYYAPTYAGGPGVAMYQAPRPVPPLVGNTYYTYQPFLPHEFLYPHRRVYYFNHGGAHYLDPGHHGAGGNGGPMINKTTVIWQRGVLRQGPLPIFKHASGSGHGANHAAGYGSGGRRGCHNGCGRCGHRGACLNGGRCGNCGGRCGCQNGGRCGRCSGCLHGGRCRGRDGRQNGGSGASSKTGGGKSK